MALNIGQQAPDFALPDQDGKDFHFSSLRGHNILLLFYLHDFSPV